MRKFIHHWIIAPLMWAIPMAIVSTLLGFRVDWRLWAFVWCAMVLDTVVDAIYPER